MASKYLTGLYIDIKAWKKFFLVNYSNLNFFFMRCEIGMLLWIHKSKVFPFFISEFLFCFVFFREVLSWRWHPSILLLHMSHPWSSMKEKNWISNLQSKTHSLCNVPFWQIPGCINVTTEEKGSPCSQSVQAFEKWNEKIND